VDWHSRTRGSYHAEKGWSRVGAALVAARYNYRQLIVLRIPGPRR
jgi:hypothetical protein